MSDNIEIIVSQRGSSVLLKQGFRYNILRKNKKTISWICRLRSCHASIVADLSTSDIMCIKVSQEQLVSRKKNITMTKIFRDGSDSSTSSRWIYQDTDVNS